MRLVKKIIPAAAALILTVCIGSTVAAESYPDIKAYSESRRILPMTAYSQEESSWCWAACSQMMLKFYGVSMRQSEIVQRTKKTKAADNTTAYPTESAQILSDVTGAEFLNCEGIFYTVKTQISGGHPVILSGQKTNSEGVVLSHQIVCRGYDITDKDQLVLYIIDPDGGYDGTLTCPFPDSSEFEMHLNDTDYTFKISSLVYTEFT